MIAPRSLATVLIWSGLATAALGEWKEVVATDRLTGEKEIRFSTPGTGTIRQFGRSVSAIMLLSCQNVFQNKPPEEDYYSAVIVFSEAVGVIETPFRYRFDNSQPRSITATLSDRGNILFASWPKNLDEFIPALKDSARLKVEIALPWAGDVLLEFKTAGAAEAMNKIPCGDNRARPSTSSTSKPLNINPK